MPRPTKHPAVFLALSPAATATALGISPAQIAAAIAAGDLIVRACGTKRRILVADIEHWVRRSWKPAKQPKRKS